MESTFQNDKLTQPNQILTDMKTDVYNRCEDKIKINLKYLD
jgi:hypothetical protein